MKHYTWYIDMDDTICDFSGQAYLDLLEEPNIKYPQSQHGFFTKLKPLPNAIESLKELVEMGEDVWILTRPSINNPLCYTDKFLWIRDHLGIEFANRLILCTDKGRVGTEDDYLIDDFDWANPKDERLTPWKGTQLLFGEGKYHNWIETMKYIKNRINE
jgi:5'(3')-deoxyribonucleotidase